MDWVVGILSYHVHVYGLSGWYLKLPCACLWIVKSCGTGEEMHVVILHHSPSPPSPSHSSELLSVSVWAFVLLEAFLRCQEPAVCVCVCVSEYVYECVCVCVCVVLMSVEGCWGVQECVCVSLSRGAEVCRSVCEEGSASAQGTGIVLSEHTHAYTHPSKNTLTHVTPLTDWEQALCVLNF